jgi:NAD(P)-dependent dehydrogenase (short-subunit alcohol dehydrogenase family)
VGREPGRPAGVALVTGGARRVGRAIVEALAADGWTVVIHHHRSADDSAALAAEIHQRGGQAFTVAGDLADPAVPSTLVADAGRFAGPVTCLVNNASVFDRDDVRSATLAMWQRQIDVNLRAPFFLTQAFAAQLPREASGNVINLLDQRVWNLTPDFTSYTVSKTGLWTLTRTCALALAPRIRVNAVGPGPTLPSARQTDAQFAAQCAATPLGHGTTPGEIADAVRYILSAPAMTGQMIALDGGQHLKWRRTADDPDLKE